MSTVLHRINPANWRSAVWAMRALAQLRADLPRTGTAAVVLESPVLPSSGLPGVEAVLRRRHATCLEQSLILQRWLASQGERHEVVIGVSAPGEGFSAHAWLADYRHDPHAAHYKELMRLPPPASSRGEVSPDGSPPSTDCREERPTRLAPS